MGLKPTPESCTENCLQVVFLAVLLTGIACAPSSTPDPRCTIDADGRHAAKLTQTVNGSDLWGMYFDVVDPGASRALVKLRFSVDRARHRTSGGDYDPGKINVVFKATHLASRRTLYERSEEVSLDQFMVGFYDKDITRDELQEIAFKATEDRVYPFLATWVDVAAIHAMAQEGAMGLEFEPVLQELLDDQWSNLDIKGAAGEALAKIRG